MGYGFYFVFDHFEPTGEKPAGYMVLATCDQRGCDEEINRGLGYLCGSEPGDLWDDGPGCRRYFCEKHLSATGERGGCRHRRNKPWGRVLSDMVQSPEGVYCLDRIGHEGLHAWAREDLQ